MKTVAQLRKVRSEVFNLIVKFLKPFGLEDNLVEIPKNVRKVGFRNGLISFGMTLIALGFAFMLKWTNMLIEHKLILLGVMAFMLYRGQKVVREAFWIFQASERQKFDLIFEDEKILRASQIIGKTSEKVVKYDQGQKVYKIMTNEAVLNSIKNYLDNFWRHKSQHMFDILEIVSVVAMLVIAICTNTSIPQFLFIPLVLSFVLISFFCSAYVSLNRKEYYQKHREYNNEQSLIINDLLRVPVIVRNDLDMRIEKFQKTVVESKHNITKFYQKTNRSRLFKAVVELFSQYGIIVFYLMGVEWSSIDLATIAEITATLLIVETALEYITRIAEMLNSHSEKMTVLEKETSDMSLILETYHNETEKTLRSRLVDNIKINPFCIRYTEASENDKPFTLVCEDPINIMSGEIVILYGPSGSGKSTFMNMLTERIRLEKSTEIPSTSRFMFYDEKLKFGSLSIFEELFCCCDDPDLGKMQEILENLHLWSEIKSNCIDVWKWMMEKKFTQSLSNGQKQRLILAKMLYWLDDEIDVMVLDECTSGLDDKCESDSADAERILEYVVRYANMDKKRILIISTHQNIDGFKANLSKEVVFKNLHFMKAGEKNIIKEI